MFKKMLLLLLALSLTLGAFTLSASATDNPSRLHLPSAVLAPRVSVSSAVDDYTLGTPVELYNPYKMNKFDYDEALYLYNSGIARPAYDVLWGHYAPTEDTHIPVRFEKQLHKDEYGHLYFASLVYTEDIYDEVLNYVPDGSDFSVKSDWFNFWDTAEVRNIGFYILGYPGLAETVYTFDTIEVFGYDVQTSDTLSVSRENVQVDTEQYTLVPLASLFEELDALDPSKIFEYYRIEIHSAGDDGIPRELGFLTPLDTPVGGLYPSPAYPSIYVRDGLTDPSVTSVSYEGFDLLGWLTTSVNGFLSTPLITIGGADISLGTLLGVTLGGWLFIVFLKKFAGG